MYQFIQANEIAFFEMIHGLNGNGIRFRNEPMPRGCTPLTADIVFEVNPDNQCIRLCVQGDIQFEGSDTGLSQWFTDGAVEFNDIHSLVEWLQQTLAPNMPDSASASSVSGAAVSGTQPDEARETPSSPDVEAPQQRPPPRQEASGRSITDTARVTEQISDEEKPLFLDEEHLLRELTAQVVGQSGSLEVLSSAVSNHVARSNPRHPLTLFAIGPSGVGKTRTGMSLVAVLNGGVETGRYEFLRLDMCEYREAHRVSQLIGSPQGYAGYGEGAQLVDALSRNPRTVVLFDEIEKAHPDILKVLMNAMDAGRLSSASRGSGGTREIDCRKAIFFFSSNLDCESILRALEQREAFDDPETIDEICREHMKAAGIPPELVGRIGHFLVYRPLAAAGKAEVTAMQIRETASEYGLDVRYVDPDVVVETIQAVRARGGGARVYSYQIDRLLGRVFREASCARETGPLRILGPAPFKYERMPAAAPQTAEPSAKESAGKTKQKIKDGGEAAPVEPKEECAAIGG